MPRFPLFRIFPCLLVAILLTGCASSPDVVPLKTTSPSGTHTASPLVASPDLLWTACRSEITHRGFDLQLADRRLGLLRSEPRTSCQWFELGCQDVVTAFDLAQSSLHTIRRQIILEVVPVASATDEFQLRCRVEVEQLFAPSDTVAGRVRARDILGRSAGRLPGTGGEEDVPEHWLPIGTDPALENAILNGVQTRLADNRA